MERNQVVYGFLYREGESPFYALVQAPNCETAAATLLQRVAGAGPIQVESVEVVQEEPVAPGPARVLATLVLKKRA